MDIGRIVRIDYREVVIPSLPAVIPAESPPPEREIAPPAPAEPEKVPA